LFPNPSRIKEFQIINHFDILVIKSSEFLLVLIMKHLRVRVRFTQNQTKTMSQKTKKRLSIDELKSYPGFENYTDEMAEETIASLEALSILFYEHYQKTLQQKERLEILRKESKME